MEKRGVRHALLAAFFALFVVFLYGPIATIVVLSFQGPDGGLTFPMRGVSLHWFGNLLFEPQMVGDFGAALRRSLALALIVMGLTVLISLGAGLAFRRRFV
ncbi:MAG: ABC transporter permease, partial [Acetobacteraceae bacterium]|nr:ABC transporter permease [Acetobacteraceae bacterium]